MVQAPDSTRRDQICPRYLSSQHHYFRNFLLDLPCRDDRSCRDAVSNLSITVPITAPPISTELTPAPPSFEPRSTVYMQTTRTGKKTALKVVSTTCRDTFVTAVSLHPGKQAQTRTPGYTSRSMIYRVDVAVGVSGGDKRKEVT